MRHLITQVTFTAEDLAVAQEFDEMPTEETYGLRRFPSPSQYHRRVAEILTREGVEPADKIFALAQRDWHVRGQTGCMFARLAALQATTLQWTYLVTGYTGEDTSHALWLSKAIRDSINNDGVEVVSILFPAIDRPSQAVAVVRGLVAATIFWLERDDVTDGNLRLHVRCPVETFEGQIDAWVMAFAPFNFMPSTRKGPYFELAIRAKRKPTWLFHRLNQDRAVAHLADVPLEMSDKHWEHRWKSTLRRTRMILDGEPDEVSAAKSTLAIPIPLLR
jgi:hypothetical protein